MKSATTNPFIPDANYETLKQPTQVTAKLFDYQMDAVSWMQYVENNVNSDIKYGKLSSWGACQTDILFDLETDNIYMPSSIDKFTGVFQIKGGVIADEMGLGKTLEMIALALSNKPDEDYMKKVGKKEDRLYYSRATLVHCPSHLARQWKEEVQKNTKATVAVITTINEFKNYSIDDLCSKFDIVCVSFPLLMQNKNYAAFSSDIKTKSNSSQKLHLYHWFRVILDEGHEIIDGIDKSSGYAQKRVNVPINSFSSKFRWYCTGTPFASEDIICGCMHYLIPDEPGSFFFKDLFLNTDQGEITQRNRWGRGVKKNENWAIFDIILNNFYWRNTKESVGKDEYNLPPYVEDIVIHDFAQIERCLYDDCLDNVAEKLEVCSNSIRHGSDLESVRAQMASKRSYELVTYTNQVTNYTNYIAEYNKGNRDYNAMYAQFHVWGHGDIITLKRQLQENIKCKIQAEKRVKIWSTCDPVPHATPVPKEFRPEKAKKEKTVPCEVSDMTLDQMKEELRKRGKSENGTRSVLFKRLFAIVEKEELSMAALDDSSDEDDLYSNNIQKYDSENMILKYGTKLAKIMQYLTNMWKTNPESKVIIFSKFSHQLDRIGELLRGESVPSVVVAGNVARRNKAIVEFKSKCKVILLGLGTAASGTNLTEATHVILVDPMSGTAKEIKAIESQAIARAHRRGQEKEITIVRFLMKDTIELFNYIETYGSSKLSVKEKQEEKPKAKPLFLKSKSASTLLANSPALQRAGSIANMVGDEFI
jgi:DNA repair protein RAD5